MSQPTNKSGGQDPDSMRRGLQLFAILVVIAFLGAQEVNGLFQEGKALASGFILAVLAMGAAIVVIAARAKQPS